MFPPVKVTVLLPELKVPSAVLSQLPPISISAPTAEAFNVQLLFMKVISPATVSVCPFKIKVPQSPINLPKLRSPFHDAVSLIVRVFAKIIVRVEFLLILNSPMPTEVSN